MNRKVVSFTLPPKPHPDSALAACKPVEPDKWVLDDAPPGAEPDADSASPSNNPLVIDLSADRSWFELVQLISAFPYLATLYWMERAANSWLTPPRR